MQTEKRYGMKLQSARRFVYNRSIKQSSWRIIFYGSETLSFETSNGATSAYVATPENPSQKAVIIIQEWWGLNDHIKDIAGRYAAEGFIAIAPDLYRGKIATNSDEASKMMHALELDDGLDTIRNSVEAARSKYGLSHFGITGFCMGGTFALRAACELEGFSVCRSVLR